MKRGFTLAETLITLGIIGVVAVLTIPNLIQRHQERVTVVKLKKTHAVLNSAYRAIIVENGYTDTWLDTLTDYNDAPRTRMLYKIFKPHLNIAKVCYEGPGCFADAKIKYLSGSSYGVNMDTDGRFLKFILADGTSVAIMTSFGTSYGTGIYALSYGKILVDLNGDKAPNQEGIDVFEFLLSRESIAPMGGQECIDSKCGFTERCNISKASSFGDACSAWVIFNENMDYLHCSDLSWNGKLKCN